MKHIVTSVLLLFAVFAAHAQQGHCCFTNYVSKADSLLVEKKVAMLKESGATTTSELMLIAAKSMYGTPYVGGQLGLGDTPEQFKVVIGKTDCILFVEAMLCLARTAKLAPEAPYYQFFVKQLAHCRYRNPKQIRYFSDRIHYTTEWIRNLEKRGVLKDITLNLGGEDYDHPINYMSKHPSAYKMGADDVARIKAIEDELNLVTMTVIKPEYIPGIESRVQDGDIICYVTTISGLDISHVAIACKVNGKLRFIHASSAEMKVVMDAKEVAAYAAGRRNCAGIKVVRPL